MMTSRLLSLRCAAAVLGSAFSLACSLHAQGAASVSGRAADAAGRPIANAVVRLVSAPSAYAGAHSARYTLIGDALGKFSQGGLAPGAYLVMLFTEGKGTSVLKSLSLKPGDDLYLDLDMSHSLQEPRAGQRAKPSLMATERQTSASLH